jgi:hypothetical protein
LVLVRPVLGDRWPFFADGAFGGLAIAAAGWIIRTARGVRNGWIVVVAMALFAAYGLSLLIVDVPDLVLPPHHVDVTVEQVIVTDLNPTGVRISIRTDTGQIYEAPFFVTIDRGFKGPAALTIGGFSGRVVVVAPTS